MGADADNIELQGAAVVAPTDQHREAAVPKEPKTPGATMPRIIKFLQPDGSIWEYEDTFVYPDGLKDNNNNNNPETVVQDQYSEEIHEERGDDLDLLIR